jgi:hypothetical protein
MKNVTGIKYLVYDLIAEYQEGISHFFEGIFRLDFNHLLSITFIPGGIDSNKKWPPELPANYIDENIDSKDAARYFEAATSHLVIISDDILAGTVHHVPTNYEEDYFTGFIFYVSIKDYSLMQSELIIQRNRYLSFANLDTFDSSIGPTLHRFLQNEVFRYIESNLGGDTPDYLYSLMKGQGMFDHS